MSYFTSTFLLLPNASTSVLWPKLPRYRDKEKIIKQPRSKGQKRGRGRGNKEHNKQQKADRPSGRGSFLRTRHGVLAKHILVTAWQGRWEGQQLATEV